MIFDSHCHLFDEKFSEDISKVIEDINSDNDFAGAIIGGTDKKDWDGCLAVANMSKKLFMTVGVHPEYANSFEKDYLLEMEKMLKLDKVVGVGEIGLDYYWEPYDKELQMKCFKEQFCFAKDINMPVVIHQRNVGQDILNFIKENKGKNQDVVLHCFSESGEMAKEFVKLGCYISLAGPLTFKNAGKLLDVAKIVPDELLLAETDSPYLTPHPFRGTRNIPQNTKLVVEKLKSLREDENIENKILENTLRVFKKVKL